MNNLDLTPAYKKLQSELQTEKARYLTLILERKHLFDTRKPNLEARFVISLGYRKLELLQKQAEVAGLKFEMELRIAAMNRQEDPDEEELRETIHRLLEAYFQKIEAQAGTIDEAQQRLRNLMSPEDSAEIRQLYYELAKKLHPDVNPDLTEDEKILWNLVSFSYKNGDLLTLRSIAETLTDKQPNTQVFAAVDELEYELELIKSKNSKLLSDIDEILSTFPFTLENQLNDDEWVNAELAKMEKEMEELNTTARKYQDYIEMIKES